MRQGLFGPNFESMSGGKNPLFHPMRKIGTLLGTFAFMVPSVAQDLPDVDITLVQLQPNRYEVRLRPDGDFNGFFASIVFTFRWSTSMSGTLAEFAPSPAMMSLGIYPGISGDEVVSGQYTYAPFVAFGATSLMATGQAWTAGQEVSMGTIDVIGGPVDLALVEDDWTAVNNADYYVSLGGVSVPGEIYFSTPTTLDELSFSPDGLQVLHLDAPGHWVRVVAATERDLRYVVIDPAGRTIGQGRMVVPEGSSDHRLNGGLTADGIYLVRLWSEGREQVMRTFLTR